MFERDVERVHVRIYVYEEGIPVGSRGSTSGGRPSRALARGRVCRGSSTCCSRCPGEVDQFLHELRHCRYPGQQDFPDGGTCDTLCIIRNKTIGFMRRMHVFSMSARKLRTALILEMMQAQSSRHDANKQETLTSTSTSTLTLMTTTTTTATTVDSLSLSYTLIDCKLTLYSLS